jgi:predicted glycoside hydrolase/deacetylase ChbG (UPF0249 family)
VNLAERLGFAADDRVLTLHADDVGSSHAANAAAFECLEEGSLTSGSVIVPAAWFPEAAAYAREHPEADLGVHLTLTCEYDSYRWRALTDRSNGPGLYDDEGYLWRTVAEAVEHVSVEEAERELRAQVETVLAAGIDATHLDTHMGTVVQPKFIETYVSLGLEYGIPIFAYRPNPERLRRAGLGDFWNALEPQLRRLDEAGFPVLDSVLVSTLERPPEEKEAYFKRLFAELRPGLTHFLIHPAVCSAEVTAMADTAPMRAREYELFRDRSMAEELVRLGVKTIGYRRIRDAYRSGALKTGG